MSNTVACVTLDAMCSVCGAHCATWVGEDTQGNREFALDCLDKDGQRYIVNHSDLLGAVCELAVLLNACPADLDDNNDTSVGDLLILLAAWGPTPGSA